MRLFIKTKYIRSHFVRAEFNHSCSGLISRAQKISSVHQIAHVRRSPRAFNVYAKDHQLEHTDAAMFRGGNKISIQCGAGYKSKINSASYDMYISKGSLKSVKILFKGHAKYITLSNRISSSNGQFYCNVQNVLKTVLLPHDVSE